MRRAQLARRAQLVFGLIAAAGLLYRMLSTFFSGPSGP
jgi:hypothetical protein